MCKALFVTATGTDVGKTYITALILKKLKEMGKNAGYYKAALSGAVERGGRIAPGDAEYVAETAGLDGDPQHMVSYIYKKAYSPHLAAELEGNPPDLAVIKRNMQNALMRHDYLCVEGSGGIVCPLRAGPNMIMLEDVIRLFDMNTVIVSPSSLGAINSAVLTAEYARTHGIKVSGFIMNGYDKNDELHRDNKKMIERLTGIKVAACVEAGGVSLRIGSETLRGLFSEATL